MYVLLEKNRCRNVENDCFFLFFDYLIYIYIYIYACIYIIFVIKLKLSQTVGRYIFCVFSYFQLPIKF